MYHYARKNNICEKDYSEFIKIGIPEDNEHGVPFSDQELEILWRNHTDPVAEMLLIMCYSGYRISAYLDLELNLNERFFRGGVKTSSSIDRVVPIHSSIYSLVEARIKRHGALDNLRKEIEMIRICH